MAANGSLAYEAHNPDHTSTYVVRLPSGRVVQLAAEGGEAIVTGGAASSFYGLVYSGNSVAIARWNVGSAPSSDTVPVTLLSAANQLDEFLAAGQRGDVVAVHTFQQGSSTIRTNRYLRTAAGALVKVPTGYLLYAGQPLDVAVDGDGSVAFTGASDHVPHLLRCH